LLVGLTTLLAHQAKDFYQLPLSWASNCPTYIHYLHVVQIGKALVALMVRAPLALERHFLCEILPW
jgi:hypothetical protein